MDHSRDFQPNYAGEDGERLKWVEEAIAATREWIERVGPQARVDRMFGNPGEWDYDYDTDLVNQTKQAAKTLCP